MAESGLTRTEIINVSGNESYMEKQVPLDGSAKLTGITWLNGKIYVLSDTSKRVSIFHDHPPFHEEKGDEIVLDESMLNADDITSCTSCCAIFISDYSENKCIWKIELPGKHISKKLVSGKPFKLSTTLSDELLVLVRGGLEFSLNVYNTSNLDHLQDLSFPSEVKFPIKVSQSSNSFIVLYGADQYDVAKKQCSAYAVSEISNKGVILRTFLLTSKQSSESSLSFVPTYSTLDKYGNIYVCDFDNNRVLILDSELQSCQILLKSDHPHRLAYIGEKHMLLVGRWSPGSFTMFDLSNTKPTPPPNLFKELCRVRNNKAYLVENVTPVVAQLIDQLLSKGCINKEQKDNLDLLQHDSEKSEELTMMLLHFSRCNQFSMLVDCLRNLKLGRLSDVLEIGGVAVKLKIFNKKTEKLDSTEKLLVSNLNNIQCHNGPKKEHVAKKVNKLKEADIQLLEARQLILTSGISIWVWCRSLWGLQNLKYMVETGKLLESLSGLFKHLVASGNVITLSKSVEPVVLDCDAEQFQRTTGDPLDRIKKDDVDDLTICVICLEKFTDPVSMPCLHTFCLKCLEQAAKDLKPGDQLPCPCCRTDYTLTNQRIRGLPVNFIAKKLVDRVKEPNSDSGGSPQVSIANKKQTQEHKSQPGKDKIGGGSKDECSSLSSSSSSFDCAKTHK